MSTGNEQFNTRLSEPYNERVHEFAELEGGLTKSEAIRRLVYRGLVARSIIGRIGYYLGWMALVTFTAAAWFWGVGGGLTDPVAAATTAEVAMGLVLTAVYPVAAAVAEAAARGHLGKLVLSRPWRRTE